MSTPTIQDIFDSFFNRLKTAPSFLTKSDTWDSFENDLKSGRPAFYLTLTNTNAVNNPDGLPALFELTMEVLIRCDRRARPNVAGIRLLLPLEEELKKVLAPSPVDGFQTLGFKRGWVMHAQYQSSVYMYDLVQDNDVCESLMTWQVFCAPEVVQPTP